MAQNSTLSLEEKPRIFICYRMEDRVAFEIAKSFYFYAKAEEEQIGKIYFSSAEEEGNTYTDLQNFVSDVEYFVAFIGEGFLKGFDTFEMVNGKKEPCPIAAKEMACAIEALNDERSKAALIQANIYGNTVDPSQLFACWEKWQVLDANGQKRPKFSLSTIKKFTGTHDNDYPRCISYDNNKNDPMEDLFERILTRIRGSAKPPRSRSRQAYMQGRRDGLEEGTRVSQGQFHQWKEDGIREGKKRGYECGLKEGMRKCYIECKKNIWNAAKAEGYTEGYKEGKEAGKREEMLLGNGYSSFIKSKAFEEFSQGEELLVECEELGPGSTIIGKYDGFKVKIIRLFTDERQTRGLIDLRVRLLGKSIKAKAVSVKIERRDYELHFPNNHLVLPEDEISIVVEAIDKL